MSIQIKFFASLREHLGTDASEVPADAVATIEDCWRVATNASKLPVNTLYAINMQYAKLDAPVQDGDEVAFFPPVTGG